MAGNKVSIYRTPGKRKSKPVSKIEKKVKKKLKEEIITIRSPGVGYFFWNEDKREKPLKKGKKVNPGDKLGCYEALKIMYDIKINCKGIIKEIYVENGQVIQYTQPLFEIKPLKIKTKK